MTQTQTLKFKRTIAAPPTEVYRAFTHPTALRDWLADAAVAEARPGGRLYLWWQDGYAASGQFTKLEPGKKVAFTWHSPQDPEPTRVQATLNAKDGGTQITVTHAGFGSGKKWTQTVTGIKRGWEHSLENLQTMLETGNDLRQLRRPRLGIFIGEFSPENAAQLGVPVKAGIRLAGTMEGSGAQAAGLQPDDVIVRLGGKKAVDFPSLALAMQGKQAGEWVPVVFYRGGEKQTVKMQLSAWPTPPPVPATGEELAARARQVYGDLLRDFAARLEGVTEAEADHRPAPGEWTLKELVAHFIACERDLQSWMADMVRDNEVGDSLQFRPNITPRLAAIVARYPTLPSLLEELRCASEETVAFVAALPETFMQRRHLVRRIANWIGVVVPSHLGDEHGAQVQSTLEAARQGRTQ